MQEGVSHMLYGLSLLKYNPDVVWNINGKQECGDKDTSHDVFNFIIIKV